VSPAIREHLKVDPRKLPGRTDIDQRVSARHVPTLPTM
jgi:hypothetical protein